MRVRFSVIAIAFVVLTACIHGGEGGANFDEAKVASIKIGTTTRDQVQALLGLPPHRNKVDAREVWVYAYGTQKTPGFAAAQGASVAVYTVGILADMVIPGASIIAAVPSTMAQGSVNLETTSKTLTVEFNLGVVTSCSYTATKGAASMRNNTTDSETTSCGQ